MKKILLLFVVVVLFGCASAPVEFDPTETPFEGEWNTINTDDQYILTYTFTGNRYEYKLDYINNDENDYYSTGLFSYTEKKVLYSNEKGKGTQGKIQLSDEKSKFSQEYELRLPYELVLSRNGYFTKQPYGDLVNSYFNKEKKFSDIVTNEKELNSIQGTWRGYNRLATYIFSEDKFTVNAQGKKPVNGTIKIKDNILYLIISDEKFGIFYVDFLPDNRIFLNELLGYLDLWWGEYIKQ